MRNIFFTFLFLLFSFTFTSCTIETSGNGDLDGAWRIIRINDNAPEQTQLYWNFQGKLLELRDKKDGCGCFLLRFKHEGSTLKLSEPYKYNREEGDKPLEDTALLLPFGIENIDEALAIECDGSRMTLKSTNITLNLRKF